MDLWICEDLRVIISLKLCVVRWHCYCKVIEKDQGFVMKKSIGYITTIAVKKI